MHHIPPPKNGQVGQAVNPANAAGHVTGNTHNSPNSDANGHHTAGGGNGNGNAHAIAVNGDADFGGESDAELLRQLGEPAATKSTKDAAMQTLVVRYREVLLSEASTFINNRTDAEEVVQIAWINAYTSARSFWPGDGPRASALPWLRRIVERCALNWLRGAGRRRKYNNAAATERHNVIDSHAPATLDRLSLYQAIEQLPDKDRAVITAYYFLAYSQRDTAKALHISLGTINVRLADAHERLRQILSA